MTFHFRLAKVEEWYGEQCRQEEDRLRERIAALNHSREELARAGEARTAIERDLMQSTILPAAELLALARYRRRAIQDEARLSLNHIRCGNEMQAQLALVQQARRRVRLIGKIRERRLGEYTVALNRELENLAADAFRAVHFTH